MHKHHIIPRYEGGSDFSENLVELTVTQHAMWHYAEWRRKERWEDRIAWQGLAGHIGKDKLLMQVAIESGKRAGSHPKPMLQRQDLDERALEIRKEYEAGATTKDLKKKYGCGQGTILKVLRGAGTKLRIRGLKGPRPHANAAKTALGKKWWTNGQREILTFDCPPGWIKGRLR